MDPFLSELVSSPYTIFIGGVFVMAASCYLLFITSDPLERIGGRLGKLLHLPEDVIASTFQALATSGPEIVMAILAASAFVAASQWDYLTIGERGSSGCLNMCFSAMDNLLGIGCVGMIFMMYKKYITADEVVVVAPSVKVGLVFYLISSTLLCAFITFSSFTTTITQGGQSREITAHKLNFWQAWTLMGIGIAFIICQFFLPRLISKWYEKRVAEGKAPAIPDDDGVDDDDDDEAPLPTTFAGWFVDLFKSGFVYAFLVFALVVFVRECLAATFNMATVGFVSVGGVLIMFTSYVSSFPEFMMTYRYAVKNMKSALLGMLFGSNVIDLAFAGFRAIRHGGEMEVYTTGRAQFLFPVYLWCLPLLALITLIALNRGAFRYKHAYPLVVLYLVYIISGFVLL